MKRAGLFFLITLLFIWKASAQMAMIDSLSKKAEHEAGKKKLLTLGEACMYYSYIHPDQGVEFGIHLLKEADSLKIPSAKSIIFNNIAVNYLALADLNNARIYLKKARENALVFNDSTELSNFFTRLGLIYEREGKFDSCLIVFQQGLEINKKLKNDYKIANSLENIATIHLNRGEFKSAMTNLLEAKKFYEKAKKNRKLAYVYLKLGQIYSETDDSLNAGFCFRKGIEISRTDNDFQKVGLGLNSLGILYKKYGRYNEALTKFNEALEAYTQGHNPFQTIAVYTNMGLVYNLQKQYDQALKFFRQAIDMATKTKNPLSAATAQFNMGDTYYKMKNYNQARALFEQALPVYQSSKIKSNLVVVYEALIKVNNDLKDYSKSVTYYQLLLAEKDSLNQKELNRALDSLKISFHTEQTESENKLLTEKQSIQSKTISLQRALLLLTMIVILLIIILVLVIVRKNAKLNEANTMLGIKNQEISEKVEELDISNNKLTELSKLKDSMTSFLIHDLKNPLNAIINVDFRQLSEFPLEAIKHAGKKILNIVNNLLDVTKYESSSMKLSFEQISLTEIIIQAFDDVKYAAEMRMIQLKLNFENDFILRADPGILERVFVNLFTNAIRYSKESGEIRIFAVPEDHNKLKITVQDNGYGIEPELLPIIFDKLTLASGGRNQGSTGIGLVFCKMAVEAHSGEIGVESELNKGSSFWFYIPVAEKKKDSEEHHVKNNESECKESDFCLSEDEINILTPLITQLKQFKIHQVSDIKDVIKSLNDQNSKGICKWKAELMNALSECNAGKYDELLKINPDVKK